MAKFGAANSEFTVSLAAKSRSDDPGVSHPSYGEGERMSILSVRRSRRGLLGSAAAVSLSLTMMLGDALAQDATLQPYEAPENIADLSGTVVADGSSTVGPVTEALAEEFAGIAPRVQLEVSTSGTGGGFERFCNGETDLQNASREIKPTETEACAANGVEYYVFEVAYDGIAIVVNPENDFVDCLTVDQLKLMWQPEAAATSWNQIDPAFPDKPITLYGPGTSSGT